MTLARPKCKGPNETLGDAWLKIGVLDKGDGQEQVTDIIWFGMILIFVHTRLQQRRKRNAGQPKAGIYSQGKPTMGGGAQRRL